MPKYHFTATLEGGGFALGKKGDKVKPSSAPGLLSGIHVEMAAVPQLPGKEAVSGGPDVATAGTSLTDDEILRGIRFVETAAGRRSKGKTGGYDEASPSGTMCGAYQIDKNLWGPKIKAKYGWDVKDWYNPGAEGAEKTSIQAHQDQIAKEMLLPDWKSQVKGYDLYDTPLGKHVPKGLLEIAAQLGPAHLKNFMNTGEDRTATKGMQQGQILNYLQLAGEVVGKPLGKGFYKALAALGGVTTKYAKK